MAIREVRHCRVFKPSHAPTYPPLSAQQQKQSWLLLSVGAWLLCCISCSCIQNHKHSPCDSLERVQAFHADQGIHVVDVQGSHTLHDNRKAGTWAGGVIHGTKAAGPPPPATLLHCVEYALWPVPLANSTTPSTLAPSDTRTCSFPSRCVKSESLGFIRPTLPYRISPPPTLPHCFRSNSSPQH